MDTILAKGFVVAPVDVFITMGKLSRKDYEDWRFGRIPYLEQKISGNLSVIGRILDIIKFRAEACQMKPSVTVYRKMGKGAKHDLRFSKYHNPHVELRYSTHYVSEYLRLKAERAKASPVEETQESSDAAVQAVESELKNAVVSATSGSSATCASPSSTTVQAPETVRATSIVKKRLSILDASAENSSSGSGSPE